MFFIPLYSPAILSQLDGFILPKNVPANEFLNLEGQKLSTSRNWAVWANEYLNDFNGQEDVLRYVLCSIAPENKDSDFSWKDFQARNNNELCSIYGNFVNRSLVLTHKYYDGKAPSLGGLITIDQKVIIELKEIPKQVEMDIRAFRFRDALSNAMSLTRLGNKYLAETEPWKLIKSNPERVKTIINISLQITANLTIILEPFMPKKSKELASLLNIDLKKWDNAGNENLISEGHQINKPNILFTKIEDKIEKQIEKLESSIRKQSKYPPMKEEITFDEFSKMDIRVGLIKAAEKVEKS